MPVATSEINQAIYKGPAAKPQGPAAAARRPAGPGNPAPPANSFWAQVAHVQQLQNSNPYFNSGGSPPGGNPYDHPAQPQAAPQAAPTPPPPPSPYDAQASLAISGQTAKTNTDIAKINQSEGYSADDLQRALGQLAYKEPLDQQAQLEKYNREGLATSGHYGQALGELLKGYGDKQSLLQTNAARTKAGREQQKAALQEALRQYIQQQGLNTADRRANAAARDLSLGV